MSMSALQVRRAPAISLISAEPDRSSLRLAAQPAPGKSETLSGVNDEQGPVHHRHRQCRPHAGRLVQRRAGQPAGARARQGRHQGRAGARARRGGRRVRGDPGPDPCGRRRPEPGAAGLDQRRHPGRCAGLGHEPALRLGPARGGARRPADPARLLQDRHRRRPGEHEPGAALLAHARRHQDGRRQVHRHDDQGRPVGRLQRLSHGHHGRERGAPVADHARGAGPLRGRLAEQGRGRQEGRQVQGRDRPRHHQDPQGRDGVRRGRVHQGRRDLRRARQAEARLRQGRHRDGRPTPAASTTAPPPSC